jgi:hypothetical protein
MTGNGNGTSFCGTGVCIQCLTLARQALYHLSQLPSIQMRAWFIVFKVIVEKILTTLIKPKSVSFLYFLQCE